MKGTKAQFRVKNSIQSIPVWHDREYNLQEFAPSLLGVFKGC